MMRAIYRIRRRASGHAQDEAGFTMVEMVIAIFIFAMVITGVGVGMSSALNLTRQNRNRSIAANLAAQQMDTIRSTDFDTLDQMTQLVQPTTITPTPTVEGVPYTITQDTHWVRKNATGAAAGPCQSPPTAANPLAYIAVTTTVTWSDMHGVLPVQTDTVVSPPVGVYDQTEGHIRVTVLNAAGPPVSGAIVTIANPTAGVSDTATTGADGCAFFAYQPVGAYTVTLSSGVGKVDGQGSATPVQNVTVKSASTSTVQFVFDTAASSRSRCRPTRPDTRCRRRCPSRSPTRRSNPPACCRTRAPGLHARSRACSPIPPDSRRGPGAAPTPTRKG